MAIYLTPYWRNNVRDIGSIKFRELFTGGGGWSDRNVSADYSAPRAPFTPFCGKEYYPRCIAQRARYFYRYQFR